MASTEIPTLSAEVSGRLNAPRAKDRLAALTELAGEAQPPWTGGTLSNEVNNHVHTIYSFSPYSPTLAAVMARAAGLEAVGSVDHDSISAAREMTEACRIIGIGGTVGCELRVNVTDTRMAGRKLNNPDSVNIAYMVIHGVPRTRIAEVEAFLEPIHVQRNRRNRAQVERLNQLIRGFGIDPIDFESDVAATSQAAEGGSITERHILAALSRKILALQPAGQELTGFLRGRLGLTVPESVAPFLRDPENPHLLYDLLGVLKSSFLERIFIQPDETECIAVGVVVDFANRIGAIPAYAYLGDVGVSATGDKKPEKFEDSFLDELFPELARIGFKSVTYMPPRNSAEQLLRVQQLCAQYGFLEISGVDINSSRQSFRCPEVMLPQFAHLNDTTWALIAHENASTCDPRFGLFAADNPIAKLTLPDRIRRYAGIGRKMDRRRPESICGELIRLAQE
ncbi:MAG TPA: PHP domain-containing protein [Spirochaetia bacterium]|nr:PHP domain-containing protein [Spirochaetia bacterium]